MPSEVVSSHREEELLNRLFKKDTIWKHSEKPKNIQKQLFVVFSKTFARIMMILSQVSFMIQNWRVQMNLCFQIPMLYIPFKIYL